MATLGAGEGGRAAGRATSGVAKPNLMELGMDDAQKQSIVAADLATVEIIDMLISFLEGEGLIERAAFIAYARGQAASLPREGASKLLHDNVRVQIDALDPSTAPSRTN